MSKVLRRMNLMKKKTLTVGGVASEAKIGNARDSRQSLPQGGCPPLPLLAIFPRRVEINVPEHKIT